MKALTASLLLVAAALPGAAEAAPPEPYANVSYSHLDGSETALGAVTVRLGARFNRYVSAEVEGSIGVKDDTIEQIMEPTRFDVELVYDAAAYGVASLPVSDRFDVFARAGFGTTELKAKAPGIIFSEEGDSFNYGLGANLWLDADNGIRADWTRREYDLIDVTAYSVGYVRRF